MSDKLIIDLNTKSIKKLNNFNQITKRVFNGMYLFNNNIIMSDTASGNRVGKGIHFATSIVHPIDSIPDNICLYLVCDKIFKIIRDYKKNITHLLIKDHIVYIGLNDGTREQIGYTLDDFQSDERTMVTSIIHNHMKSSVEISKNIVNLLCDNLIYTYTNTDYKIRLTRELLPALKNDMSVSISFKDDINPTLFNVVLAIDKIDVITYHMYKCVKF